jgi:misacylated tRNA(Ala) deacylase
MTELIYFSDCYVKEFKATVLQVHGNRVVLDRTAFYPRGGGQPSDTGTVLSNEGLARVVEVCKEGAEVVHALEGPVPGKGCGVEASIDWDSRYAHMRYHTAQHLLSAYFLDQHKAKTTGNQISTQGASIDLDVESFDPDVLKGAQDQVNLWIKRSLPVKITMMPRQDALRVLNPERTRIDLLPKSVSTLRIVEAQGVDVVACAGTHVSNTSELGHFEVVKTSSKGRDRRRLEFVLH